MQKKKAFPGGAGDFPAGVFNEDIKWVVTAPAFGHCGCLSVPLIGQLKCNSSFTRDSEMTYFGEIRKKCKTYYFLFPPFSFLPEITLLLCVHVACLTTFCSVCICSHVVSGALSALGVLLGAMLLLARAFYNEQFHKNRQCEIACVYTCGDFFYIPRL